MANCMKCGQVVGEGDRHCSSCGAEVVAANQVDSEKTRTEIHKAKRNERVGWGLVIVAIIWEGIGAWLLLRNHPNVVAGRVLLALGMTLGLIAIGLTIYSLQRQAKLIRKPEQHEASR